MWKAADYPAYNYANAGNIPPTNATALSTTIVNFAVDNSNAAPVLLSSYGPDNTVIVQSPATNPFITITKTTSTVAGANRFIIKNIVVTIPASSCGNSLVFRADVWSSNSAAANAHIQCSSTNFALGIIVPIVSGSCLNTPLPPTYSFNIDAVSVTRDVYYSVYLDNGNNLFEPAVDQLLTSIPAGSPITIAPGSGYSSGPLNYPTLLDAYTHRIFVTVGVVGQVYSVTSTILSCPVALAISGTFNVARSATGSTLDWKIENEENIFGWEIQRSMDGNFEKINFVPSRANGAAGTGHSNYSYQDKLSVSGKWVYYRLKEINKNGSFSYSDIKKVYFDKNGKGFMIYPNPVPSKQTTVVLDGSFLKADVQVYTATGILVHSCLNTGNKRFELNNLQTGVYIIKVTDKATNASYSEKLIVQ
jgi:hypothetical protein